MSTALALSLLALQSQPIRPEALERVLRETQRILEAQGDPEHAMQTVELCDAQSKVAEATGKTLPAVLLEEGVKRGWSKIEYNAMVHDCVVFTMGRARERIDQEVLRATKR